ncbi:MAG TPA: 16S rRNA (cytidine(1402)-2'-O)-methyltransferase [Herpetosiphonaceae bacterium]
MGTLYLVATPIGNLEDITLRGLRILREASLVAAEDTRQTRKLLQRYEIDKPLLAYHEHNKLARLDDLLLALANGDVALVSDAGTPLISDPGHELVQTVLAAGFPVVPVPGACAAVAGLIASGLPAERFYYLGFLPRRSVERRALFAEVQAIPATLVLYETPHRLLEALDDALAVLGNRQAAIARELTKLHEQVLRGPLRELAERVADGVRGEIVLLIAGAPVERRRPKREIGGQGSGIGDQGPGAADQGPGDEEADGPVDQAAIVARLRALRDAGESGTRAAKQVARELHLDRQAVYRLWTALDE